MECSAVLRFRVGACVWLLIGCTIAPTVLAAESNLDPTTGDIKIAVVGRMSGGNVPFGYQMRRGADMAVRYLNAKGGVLGRRVKLIVEDDATDPKQAISVAKKLASQGVKFVAGHLNSGASIQASAVYAEHGILRITPYSPNPALTENAHKKGWRNVFRVYTRDDTHGIAVGRFLAENFKTKKIAILHDRTAFGNGLAYKAREILRKAGVVEAVYQAYTPRQREYSALMSQLGSAGSLMHDVPAARDVALGVVVG